MWEHSCGDILLWDCTVVGTENCGNKELLGHRDVGLYSSGNIKM